MMTAKRQTGSTATPKSVPNATPPSRRMEAVITWCVALARQSFVGNVRALGSLMGLAGEMAEGLYPTVLVISLPLSLPPSLSLSLSLYRYKCNRYNEKDSQNARDSQMVSHVTSFTQLNDVIMMSLPV